MKLEERKVGIAMAKVLYEGMIEEVHQAPRVETEECKCPFCGFKGTKWALVNGWLCCPKCGSN